MGLFLSRYDLDASGYLGRDELHSMLSAFARVGLDAVGCSLSIIANLLGEDATVENAINRHSRQQVKRIRTIAIAHFASSFRQVTRILN
eukprot:COSAG05_NODE_8727_length_677_cov_0.709343_2_plen_89_part_00